MAPPKCITSSPLCSLPLCRHTFPRMMDLILQMAQPPSKKKRKRNMLQATQRMERKKSLLHVYKTESGALMKGHLGQPWPSSSPSPQIPSWSGQRFCGGWKPNLDLENQSWKESTSRGSFLGSILQRGSVHLLCAKCCRISISVWPDRLTE